jgi:gas vesicle structural protein
MPVERTSGGTSLIDVLDRVLDKGIVIDAWVRVSLVGIDLITVEARVVVASIDTYLKYSEAVGTVAPVAKPATVPVALPEPTSTEAVMAENAALRARLAATSAALGTEPGGGSPAHVPVARKRRRARARAARS